MYVIVFFSTEYLLPLLPYTYYSSTLQRLKFIILTFQTQYFANDFCFILETKYMFIPPTALIYLGEVFFFSNVSYSSALNYQSSVLIEAENISRFFCCFLFSSSVSRCIMWGVLHGQCGGEHVYYKLICIFWIKQWNTLNCLGCAWWMSVSHTLNCLGCAWWMSVSHTLNCLGCAWWMSVSHTLNCLGCAWWMSVSHTCYQLYLGHGCGEMLPKWNKGNAALSKHCQVASSSFLCLLKFSFEKKKLLYFSWHACVCASRELLTRHAEHAMQREVRALCSYMFVCSVQICVPEINWLGKAGLVNLRNVHVCVCVCALVHLYACEQK